MQETQYSCEDSYQTPIRNADQDRSLLRTKQSANLVQPTKNQGAHRFIPQGANWGSPTVIGKSGHVQNRTSYKLRCETDFTKMVRKTESFRSFNAYRYSYGGDVKFDLRPEIEVSSTEG